MAHRRSRGGDSASAAAVVTGLAVEHPAVAAAVALALDAAAPITGPVSVVG
jgi:hypothetical protein